MKTAALEESKTDSLAAIESVLQVHFERFFQVNIDTLINSWSEDGADLQSMRNAILIIYQSVNYPEEDFQSLMKEVFQVASEDELEDVGLKESYDFLQKLHDHCSGNLMKNSNPIIQQCSRLHSLEITEFEKIVGEYFRVSANSYLVEKFPEIYSEIHHQKQFTREITVEDFFHENLNLAEAKESAVDFGNKRSFSLELPEEIDNDNSPAPSKEPSPSQIISVSKAAQSEISFL